MGFQRSEHGAGAGLNQGKVFRGTANHRHPADLPRAELLGKLGRHKTGKSCLYLKKLADVDLDTLQALIDCSVDAMALQRIRR